MNTFIVFLSEHWLLSSAFFILLIVFIVNEVALQNVGSGELPPKDAVDLMNHAEAKIIDIRSQVSFQEGHILGSLNIPVAQLEQKLKTLHKYQNDPVLIVCNLGQQAKKTATLLQKNGFKQVFVLQGGLNAWRTASLPLTKKS